MVVTSSVEVQVVYDPRAGVKGLVDAGVKQLPIMFVHDFKNPEDKPGAKKSQLSIPIIDIAGANQDAASLTRVIINILDAGERWGFFQVVNHGIPVNVMDNMINAVRKFFEQDVENKAKYCSQNVKNIFRYNSVPSDGSRLRGIGWSDSIVSSLDPLPQNFEALPLEFRDPMMEYTSHLKILGSTLYGLVSQGLGLKASHLEDIGCADGLAFVGHYYPPCPEPEKTLGSLSHTDIAFLNIILQDQVGGLQVLHHGEWVDVTPLPGALVVTLGDMMQLITNGRFKSADHRVVSKRLGPRTSVASFLGPQYSEAYESRIYGPINELISEENPPVYMETTTKEYAEFYYSNLINKDGISALEHFKM
ncbi:1-aminocyclopropane-1-carboxylate oxidase homolog 11-like [Coffea eugenioides]|uniref:1-aminocyclopropane-1-carboxylate oxidase homolog 11-like n=1 Tax=Coffea eugenioides TaxID=49369 RepID=UPI000F609B07|nr:1-aminocyclopropane-1-carboxylate oxidase homolog 11-like [Coffea eugenioides]